VTSNRDLGPILAAVGGAVILGAVIWGFIAVGGPGDARAQRLDDARLNVMIEYASRAQCAYYVTGRVPPSPDEARQIAEQAQNTGAVTGCPYGWNGGVSEASRESVSYKPLSPDQIGLCADFRQPSRKNAPQYGPSNFPELDEPRTAPGQHCYTVKLHPKPAEQATPGVAPPR
jgi:hypothetical protein